MLSPIGNSSPSGLWQLPKAAMPSFPALNDDYLTGVASKLIGRLNAIEAVKGKLQTFAEASQALTLTKGAALFVERQATSTDAKVATATARTGAARQSYELQVDQVATAHQLRSDRLDDGIAAVAAGSYAFTLTVAGKTTSIGVDVGYGETNATVLQRTAAAINAAGAGVRAEVVAGDAAGTSRLQLTSGATGTGAALILNDTTGTLLGELGLNPAQTASASAGGTSVAAQDARYRIGSGAVQTSQTNEIRLGDEAVSVSLKGVGKTSIHVGVDAGKVGEAIEAFVNAYNDVLGYSQSVGSALPGRVAQSLSGMTKANYSSLAAIGINRAADGSLRLDKAKLTSTLQANPERVSATFGDARTGIAGAIRQSLDALGQGLNAEARTSSRQLVQAFTRQQLGVSYGQMGPGFQPISQLLLGGGGVFNLRI